jgi:hypothetical protein
VNGDDHPTRAYNNKGEVLKDYVSRPELYERFQPVVKDILTLHDTISSEAAKIHTQQGGRGGSLDFVKVKKTRRGGKTDTFTFHFLNTTGTHQLDRAALYPMLGAFRWMIVERSDGNFGWRDDNFSRVLAVWNAAAGDMMRATVATHREYKYKLTNLGKSGTHWGTMFNMVARHELQSRSTKA